MDHAERRRVYNSKRWKTVRVQALARDLYRCVKCQAPLGIRLADHAVDHITPMEQGGAAYDLANLQSLCAPCHNSLKQAEERRGFRPDAGDDGWPVDPRHPANRCQRRLASEL